MKKLLLPTICFMIGISTGFNLRDNETMETVVHDGKFQDTQISQVEFYDDIIQNVNTMEIYDTSELNAEIMGNRDGKIIVEKIIGKVVNDSLDGRILNCNAEEGGYTNKDGGNYINYERVEGAKKGDKILTYYIYNPFTNAQDDVWTRMDFIIDCNSI